MEFLKTVMNNFGHNCQLACNPRKSGEGLAKLHAVLGIGQAEFEGVLGDTDDAGSGSRTVG